jgi:DNA ligase-1
MFNLQLANTYSPSTNYGVSHWYSSPKLDGVRCLYIPGKGLISRSGKSKYVGLEHIEKVCETISNGRIIDGELYIPGETFDKVSGIVRDTKGYDVAQKQRVKFNVFASYDPQVLLSTSEMIEGIKNALPSNQNAIVAVPYALIENNPVAIQAQNQLNKDSGASLEGTMLRHPDLAYYLGRSQHLLKVKNFYKSEFVITNFAKGTGKYSKSLGKLTVQGTVNGVLVSSKVGTGFTDAERQQIWDNQNNYLNAKCNIIYMSATATSLRLPVFCNFS